MVKFLMDWQLFIVTLKKILKKFQKRATLMTNDATRPNAISKTQNEKQSKYDL